MTNTKIFSALLFIFSSAIIGCTSSAKTNSTEFLFSRMIETSEAAKNELIPLYSMELYKESGNKWYDKIFHSKNADINYLLKKILSEEETNFCIPNIAVLTEGDLALHLAIEILELNDSYFTNHFVPEEIKDQYETKGSSVWYQWIHRTPENRQWIYQQAKTAAANKIGLNDKHEIEISSRNFHSGKGPLLYGIRSSKENYFSMTADKNEFVSELESIAKEHPGTDLFFRGECAANWTLCNLKQVLRKSKLIESLSEESYHEIIYVKTKSGTNFRIFCRQNDTMCTCPGN